MFIVIFFNPDKYFENNKHKFFPRIKIHREKKDIKELNFKYQNESNNTNIIENKTIKQITIENSYNYSDYINERRNKNVIEDIKKMQDYVNLCFEGKLIDTNKYSLVNNQLMYIQNIKIFQISFLLKNIKD